MRPWAVTRRPNPLRYVDPDPGAEEVVARRWTWKRALRYQQDISRREGFYARYEYNVRRATR